MKVAEYFPVYKIVVMCLLSFNICFNCVFLLVYLIHEFICVCVCMCVNLCMSMLTEVIMLLEPLNLELHFVGVGSK